MSPHKPLTAIIVGAGHRAVTYASYAHQRPDELRIVGVADPRAHRRQHAAQLFDLSPSQCFQSAEQNIPSCQKVGPQNDDNL